MSDLTSKPVINSPETLTSTGVLASQAKQLFDGNPDGMYFGSIFASLNGAQSAAISVTSTGTTNGNSITMDLSASTGILRGLLSLVSYSGTYAGSGTLNVYGFRGYSKLTGTISGGSTVYLTGIQGKVGWASTAVMTGGRMAGVLAQIDAKDSATISGGEIAGLWIDNQFGAAVGSGNTLDGIHIETSDATINLDAFLKVYGKATQFITFEGAYSDYVIADSTAFSGLTPNFKVKVNVGGTACYIHMTTA